MSNTSIAQKNHQRYDHIDLLEAIAMLFVVIQHGTVFSIDIINDASITAYIHFFVKTFLAVCVPLFFLCNGYLLFCKPLNIKKHLIKTLRLTLLTIIWASITLLVLMFIEQDSMTPGEFGNALWNWRQDYINHLWYMGALICIYLLFPLLKVVFDHHKLCFIYFICMCTIFTIGNTFLDELLSIGLHILTGSTTVINRNLSNIFNPFRGIFGYTFVYFCLGGLLHHYEDRLLDFLDHKCKTHNRLNIYATLLLMISCILLSCTGVIFSHMTNSTCDIVYDGFDSALTLFMVFASYLLCLNYKPRHMQGCTSFIRTVSINTLGIYFMHVPFIHLTIFYVQKFSPACTIFGNILYALLNMSCCILIAAICKKIPVLRELFRT